MSAPHEHQVEASDTVFEGRIITVRKDQVTMPGDTTSQRDVVEHPGAVGIAALDDEGRVLLVNQYRHPVGRRLDELPAGLLDKPGEPALAAAQRELAEEAGLAADHWEALTPDPIALSNSMTDEVARLWLATGLRPHDVPSDDPTEDLRVIRMPFGDALAACLDGRIDDAMTVLGLLLVDRRRRTSA